jgi:hypothetical protein
MAFCRLKKHKHLLDCSVLLRDDDIMKIQIFSKTIVFLFSMLVLRENAQAQYVCAGGGPGPGEVVVGRIPPSNGVGAIFLCAKTDEGQAQPSQQPSPPKPVTYTNIAQASVAWHPSVADVWAVWDVSSIDRLNPEDFVVNACTRAVGPGCILLGSVENGTMALARSQIGTIRIAAGRSQKEAKGAVMADCEKANLRCSFMKTFTAQDWFQRPTDKSRMRIYDPSRSKAGIMRKFVGAAALSKGPKPWSEKVWISGGHTTFEAANQAAMVGCQKDSNAQCQLAANNAHGVILVGTDTQNTIQAVSEQTMDLAQNDVKKKCAILKMTCTVRVTFDVATPGTQSFDVLGLPSRVSQ